MVRINESRSISSREQLLQSLACELQSGRQVYVGAPTGMGKTYVLNRLAERLPCETVYVSARVSSWLEKVELAAERPACTIIVDDIQEIVDQSECARFLKVIDNAPKSIRFVMAGRSDLPGYLKMGHVSGRIAVFDSGDLALNEEEVRDLLDQMGARCTSDSFERLCEKAMGWCAYVMFAAMHVDEAGEFSAQSELLTLSDVYDYCEWSVWARLSSDQQRFLMQLAHLQEFDVELARVVSGMDDASRLIGSLLDLGGLFRISASGKYRFRAFVRSYLLHKREFALSKSDEAACYERTAKWYYDEGDLASALSCYELADNKDAIMRILIENGNRHPGDAIVYELERYYLELDEGVVSQSPELLASLAMFHSISLRVGDCLACVKKLEALERSLPRTDPRKRLAQEKLAYLSIALPNQGNQDTIKRVLNIAKSRRSIQQVSLTGNMPGVLNGGKDLLEWSKNERLVYRTLSLTACSVFGDYANGIPDVGLAESLFEKSSENDFTESISLLNRAKLKGSSSEYEQLNFAANGILGRILVCCDKLDVARKMIMQCRRDARVAKKFQLVRNIDAYLVWLDLVEGNVDAVNRWMKEESPDEIAHFYTLERYRYLVKVKCYILQGLHMEAMCLLDQLEEYFKEYERTYNLIEERSMSAIVLYRMGDGAWRDKLRAAVKSAESYEFIRVISDLGAAILGPLEEMGAPGSTEYFQRLLYATKQQAALYPDYLKQRDKVDYGLTAAEQNVLRLIAEGLTNAEVSEALHISVATVKSHAGSIYAKLGVKNRVSAARLAKQNDIV